MLTFGQLSYWERTQYLEQNTFVVVGAGLVGMSTALSLKERFPNEKILILERGYLPTGASTKNAGFACFGSPTELQDDLQNMPAEIVWQTVELRLKGLEQLKNRVGQTAMDYRPCGSWDLLGANEPVLETDFVDALNAEMKHHFGLEHVYTIDPYVALKFGLKGFHTAYFNPYEGSINTAKLLDALYKKCIQAGIQFLFTTEVKTWQAYEQEVEVQTQHGHLRCAHLLICTNGFAQDLFAQELKPARAQVLITKPLKHQITGTFHSERGYYYFRDIGQRILIGGGRHLDFETETSTVFAANECIRTALLSKLSHEILPGQAFEIDYEWTGIMGVGPEKKPLIRSLNKNVHAGVRMGGMGIAIGTAVGTALSKLV
ncbi:MAG: NAD(P)/FAD-dependent oxidoreductase [Flavobacteriales bacterium]